MLSKTIPSYLYKEYDDDEDLQAFVEAYNEYAQDYVDWFNEINLPIYTGQDSLVAGDLLDWVGNGLYGFPRPLLPFGNAPSYGAINGFVLDGLAINAGSVIDESTFYSTDDDVYRRCLTWLFYKADGKEFTIRWLKRRVMRFLTGANGIGTGINQTYRISVTFGPGAQDANINVLNSLVTVKSGPLNASVVNFDVLNGGLSSSQTFPAFPLAPIFKAAFDAGILEAPFTYDWTVNI